MAQQSLQAAKTMSTPRDTRALCTRRGYKLTRFTKNNILQDLHDSLDLTIAEWKLRNGILIFWNLNLSNEAEYMYMYDLKIVTCRSYNQVNRNPKIYVFF